MADLAGGKYPQSAAISNLLGSPSNSQVTGQPIRSNLEWLGVNGLADTAASLVTQVMTVVPVPVDSGVSIKNISMLVGATAAGTPTNSWAALYAGTNTATPALIAQTADGTTTAISASARFDFSFTNTNVQTITPALAPYGYIFVAIMVKATTVPSLVTVPNGAAAAQYAWFSNFPGASFASVPGTLAFSAGSSLTTTAPTTLTSVAAKTVAPAVFLW